MNNRNKKCLCGSGKKFKNCCMDKIPRAKKQLKEMLHWDEKSLLESIRKMNMKNNTFIKRLIRFIKNIFHAIATVIKGKDYLRGVSNQCEGCLMAKKIRSGVFCLKYKLKLKPEIYHDINMKVISKAPGCKWIVEGFCKTCCHLKEDGFCEYDKVKINHPSKLDNCIRYDAISTKKIKAGLDI